MIFCFYSLTGTSMVSLILKRKIITIQNKKLDNFCTYLYTFFFLSFTNKSEPDNLFESTKSLC